MLNAGHIKPALARQQAKVKTGNTRGGRVQHVKVGTRLCSQLNGGRENGIAIQARQCALADNNHRFFGFGENVRKALIAGQQLSERFRPCADEFGVVSQIYRRANGGNREVAHQVTLTDTRIQHRRLEARIGADEKQRIGLFNAGNGGVENIIAARAGEFRTVLTAINMRAFEAIHQALKRELPLGADQISGNGSGLCALALQPIGNQSESIIPARRRQLAVFANKRAVETLRIQPVPNKARFIGQPFFIHIIMVARHDAHGFAAAHIDTNIAAQRVHDVNGFGFAKLPGARGKRIGARGQSTDRAQIDHIARQFAIQRGFEIGGDFRILTATNGTDFRHACHFLAEANTTCAMNAPRHYGFNQRPHILVFDGTLIIVKTAGVTAKAECLILQVALTALVANRTIQRVIDEQKLHHAFTCGFYQLRLRRNDHVRGDRHGATGDGLWCIGHFDQTHAAIAGNRQALVIAKARNFSARFFACL